MAENSGLIASALEKSNPDLYLSMGAGNVYRTYVKQQGARVALYRDYERGDHRAVITTQMRKLLRLTEDDSGMVDFNGNYCGIVIDKMAGRLHVSEITTNDTTVDEEWLSPLLEKNSFDNLQSATIRGAIRDADSYIMVDPQTLDWTSEPAYDGYSGVVAIFETGEHTPIWACKIWNESETQGMTTFNAVMRLVVYQPGSVSYWRGIEGAGEVESDDRVTMESDGETQTGNNARFPIQSVPLVHFVNRYENYSETGESEIRSAIPLQDIYNRTLHTLTYASENAGYTKPWSKGMEISVDGLVPGAVINLVLKDANGNVIIEPTAEMLQFLQAVQIGQIEATDTTQFITTLDKIVREISQVTQTPIYGVTADGNLSGEALKQLEIGLIGKIIRFQRQNTDAVKRLISLTAEIQNAFRIEGLGSAPEITDVAVTWQNPEILDVTSQIAALTNMRTSAPGLWSDDWYRAKIGGLLGMSQTDVAKQAEEVKAQKRDTLKNRINSVRFPIDAVGTNGVNNA
jgi:hypothetical protein